MSDHRSHPRAASHPAALDQQIVHRRLRPTYRAVVAHGRAFTVLLLVAVNVVAPGLVDREIVATETLPGRPAADATGRSTSRCAGDGLRVHGL
jgi:hypothetical protein